jgi:ring-1,2-phenylacetyl-CoA epoxidase subunit PaaC
MQKEIKDFILMLADNSMILGQRLGEWCGHGPILEQDIALTNIALDIIGEARNYYAYLAEIEGKKEDDYPMLRKERAFRNVLLVETPNGNWGDTLMRQFMFDCWHYFHLEAMTKSNDERLASIAKKSIKEASYHLSFSSEWVIRLGDGTKDSHEKMQDAVEHLLPYFEEFFMAADFEVYSQQEGISPDLHMVKNKAMAKFSDVLNEATLSHPQNVFAKKGGKSGIHTEHLGFILSELQYLQRAYPGVTW